MWNVLLTAIVASIPLARAHIASYTPAMWGWDVRAETFPYDNRPETPLQQYTFEQWWFHGHLDYPPAAGEFFELPAGGTAISQLACNKGATKYWAESDGHTDVRQGDYPCPGYPTSQFHGHDDLKGCALSIAYTSDVNSIKPEDLTIFSVNHECVWKVSTPFDIPKDMPPCPEDGCICAWHWIHSVDSGSAQMYMNGFRCKVTGSTSNTPLQKPEVPKRCTGDITKCNQGAQQPLYWYQAEGNNMFNGQYDPPYYLEEWGFRDGAQNGIFGQDDGSSNTNTNTTTPNNTPTSTPENKPSSTPVNQPTSTPVDQSTSTPVIQSTSTPVDQPTPTPGNHSNDDSYNGGNGNGGNNNGSNGNGGNNNGSNGDGSSKPSPDSFPPVTPPKPQGKDNTSLPSPSNSQVYDPSSSPKGNGKDNTNTNSGNGQPSPTKKCKPKNGKKAKRQGAIARHKRLHARDYKH